MADHTLFTTREEAFLEALVEERVQFLLVGLAAAALQGAPAVTQDIDLWFSGLSDPRFRRALDRVGAAYVAPGSSTPPLLAGGGTDFFDIVIHMHGLDGFEEEMKRSVRIRLGRIEVPVVPLERIIVSKQATGRPKDRAILPVLKDALRALRNDDPDSD